MAVTVYSGGSGGPLRPEALPTLLLDAGATARCRRRVHLDHDPAAVSAPRALPDPTLEQRRTDAVAHRAWVGARLAEAAGRDWHAVPPVAPLAERLTATSEAIAVEAPLIWGAVLPSRSTAGGAGRRGGPDLLVRLPEGGYVPVIVVHHRITDPGAGALTTPLTAVAPHRARTDQRRKVRSHGRDLLRLAHLHRMLRAAGWAADAPAAAAAHGGVVGLDADVVVWHDLAAGHWPGGRTTLAEYDVRFADRAAVAFAAATGAPALAAPSRVDECRRCPWWPTCEDDLVRTADVSLIARGEAATALRELGVRTVHQLAALDAAATAQVPGMPMPDLVALARAWRRGLTVVRRVPHVPVPRADVEVDVDMESFGESGAYLWGALLDHPGGRRDGDDADGYRAFVTWQPVPTDDEARSFAEFWSWLTGVQRRALATGRTFAAYCYNKEAENRWLLASARRFACHPGVPSVTEVEQFIGGPAWVDLFALVGEWFLCTAGKGLKRVAPVAGFTWRDPEAGGENSMRWYRHAVGMDGAPADVAQRRRLLDYNADDVAATHALRAWMCSPAVQDVPLAADL